LLSYSIITQGSREERTVSLKTFGNIDSKFRFVIIASKRAKELLKGSKPRVRTKSKNPIRIAQTEVKMGLVDYEILKPKKEEVPEREERVFLGQEVGAELEEEETVACDEEEEPEEEEEKEKEEEKLDVKTPEEVEQPEELEAEEKEEEEES
jgi:DNA-directed RNA polymerase omega subunit